jgi:holin-like protein
MIRQCAILFGCLALGELIVYLTGIKLPSSIIGMLLLTLFLKLGWIKLQWVQGLSDFLVANLGFFFVPPGVALMYFDVIAAEFWPIVIATIVSTALVLVVTGWVHQIVRKFRVARQIKLASSLRLSDFHLSDKLHLKNKTNLMDKDK